MQAGKLLARGARLVVASHNQGKLREISGLLAPFGVEAVSAGALGIPEPEETGATFEENALLKAEASAKASGLPALSDDSGLCVAALDNAPGIFSARWAGPGKDFLLAMKRVENELRAKGLETSPAHFVCVLALAFPDAPPQIFRGEVHGTVSFPPRGKNGFGYDPIFTATGMHETFGEMEPARKHAMSHRAGAFRKLVTALA